MNTQVIPDDSKGGTDHTEVAQLLKTASTSKTLPKSSRKAPAFRQGDIRRVEANAFEEGRSFCKMESFRKGLLLGNSMVPVPARNRATDAIQSLAGENVEGRGERSRRGGWSG